MDIWHFNHVTRELVGVGQADPDPLAEGEFLIPAFATTVAPPEPVEGRARCFIGDTWEQVEDHRGETWWSGHGQSVTVETLGPVVGLMQNEPPAPPLTQEELIAYVNARQWAIATGGYAATVSGTSYRFSTAPASMTMMTGKASRLSQANPPSSFLWQVGPVDFVTIPASDFLALATEISDWVQSTFDVLPSIVVQIQNGTITDTAAIDAALLPFVH